MRKDESYVIVTYYHFMVVGTTNSNSPIIFPPCDFLFKLFSKNRKVIILQLFKPLSDMLKNYIKVTLGGPVRFKSSNRYELSLCKKK